MKLAGMINLSRKSYRLHLFYLFHSYSVPRMIFIMMRAIMKAIRNRIA